MNIVNVEHVTKRYPSFALDDVSFALTKGQIIGFIGRNGAGKSTVIKAMLHLIALNQGQITYFDLPLEKNERAIKQRVGYACGAIDYYPQKTIREIAQVTKIFYKSWDEDAYQRYLTLFELDEKKKIKALSTGMKVKCQLLLALSHQAELLILDEPTSGLDPFSRDQLLDLFQLLKKQGVTIFFSTHFISDLEKCADQVIYIHHGRIKAQCALTDFYKQFGHDQESLEEILLRLERGDHS